jgi:hypothetical protein
MAANTNPIYSLAGDTQWGPTFLTGSNTAKDGTGTVVIAFTAGVDGGRVEKIIFRSQGTNTASVGRVFINNGGATSTPANNILFTEISLPATTLTEIAAQTEYSATLGFALPAGYRLTCTVGTTVAAGYAVSVIGGKY